MKAAQLQHLFHEDIDGKYVDPFRRFQDNPPVYEVARGWFGVNTQTTFAGYRSSELRSIDDFFNLIHTRDVDGVIESSWKGLTWGANSLRIQPIECESNIVFRVMVREGKLYYYHRHAVINGSTRSGRITYNCTYLHDVSWMRPVSFGGISYQTEWSGGVQFGF